MWSCSSVNLVGFLVELDSGGCCDSGWERQPSQLDGDPLVRVPHPTGFQARPELLEVFSTEFQMRLLWGSQGSSSSQARRYEKFDKVLTALSHKLEPAVRSSEL